MVLQEQLKETVEKIACGQDIEVVEFKLLRHCGAYQLSIVLYKHSGVKVDDCAKVNRALAEYLEETQILDDNFTIEVSSWGLDRKLVTREDFTRCMGKRINVLLRETLGNKWEFSGKVSYAADEEIRILPDNNQELTINLKNIKKAKLEIGWKR